MFQASSRPDPVLIFVQESKRHQSRASKSRHTVRAFPNVSDPTPDLPTLYNHLRKVVPSLEIRFAHFTRSTSTPQPSPTSFPTPPMTSAPKIHARSLFHLLFDLLFIFVFFRLRVFWTFNLPTTKARIVVRGTTHRVIFPTPRPYSQPRFNQIESHPFPFLSQRYGFFCIRSPSAWETAQV